MYRRVKWLSSGACRGNICREVVLFYKAKKIGDFRNAYRKCLKLSLRYFKGALNKDSIIIIFIYKSKPPQEYYDFKEKLRKNKLKLKFGNYNTLNYVALYTIVDDIMLKKINGYFD